MNFYRFSENNEWEGEKWHFFVPLSDEQFEQIQSLIASSDDEESPYFLEDAPLSEDDVDRFLRQSGSTTYMAEFNKCAPLTQELPEAFDPDEDVFYKGQLFEVVESCKTSVED